MAPERVSLSVPIPEARPFYLTRCYSRSSGRQELKITGRSALSSIEFKVNDSSGIKKKKGGDSCGWVVVGGEWVEQRGEQRFV